MLYYIDLVQYVPACRVACGGASRARIARRLGVEPRCAHRRCGPVEGVLWGGRCEGGGGEVEVAARRRQGEVAMAANDAKNAMSAMQKVNDTQKKLGLDVVGRPPMCHIVVNCIVALIVAPLAHWLARPDDIKSLSFLGTLVAYLVFLPVAEWIPFLGGFVWLALVVYTVFVCLMSEKRQPYAASKASSSGVVDLER